MHNFSKAGLPSPGALRLAFALEWPLAGGPDRYAHVFSRFIYRLLEREEAWEAENSGDPASDHSHIVVRAICDVYDVVMVRKQLCISEEHERALKARARELGVSEAELVRRMLDGLLLEGEGGTGLAGAGATEALDGFLEEADRLAEAHRFPEGYRFDREELYQDRV